MVLEPSADAGEEVAVSNPLTSAIEPLSIESDALQSAASDGPHPEQGVHT